MNQTPESRPSCPSGSQASLCHITGAVHRTDGGGKRPISGDLSEGCPSGKVPVEEAVDPEFR